MKAYLIYQIQHTYDGDKLEVLDAIFLNEEKALEKLKESRRRWKGLDFYIEEFEISE
jgi:hypothetical protein